MKFLKEAILNASEITVLEWKNSAADLSVCTLKRLMEDEIHVEIIVDFVLEVFKTIWACQELKEVSYSNYKNFNFIFFPLNKKSISLYLFN